MNMSENNLNIIGKAAAAAGSAISIVMLIFAKWMYEGVGYWGVADRSYNFFDAIEEMSNHLDDAMLVMFVVILCLVLLLSVINIITAIINKPLKSAAIISLIATAVLVIMFISAVSGYNSDFGGEIYTLKAGPYLTVLFQAVSCAGVILMKKSREIAKG